MFVPVLDTRWAALMCQRWTEIREEALALPDDLVAPWVQRAMYGEGWGLAVAHVLGHPVPAVARRCPVTASVLADIDGLAMAAFSRMRPGTEIAPHVGWGTRVHRYHLALRIPERCGIEVGGHTRTWTEGELLAFDDTALHAAWNRSSQERWVLMFDVLRPGLAEPFYEPTRIPPEVHALTAALGVSDQTPA